MLSIAVCDDEVIECCNMARKMKDILEEMKIPCIIRQFRSGGELLQALESFDRFTNKDNLREHGIGLLNVGDVVNRYNGAVHKEAQNGIFVISILMPLNDTAHDIKTAV